MTERKPPGVSFETWVDKQITDAIDRGEFDQLPGAGEPIRDLDTPYDELWVTRKLHREGLSIEDALPTPLRLRKEVERLPETVRKLRTEVAVRAAVGELNERIRAWLVLPTGPTVRLAPVDVERIVEQWRAGQTEPPAGPPDNDADRAGSPTPRGRRWRRWLPARRRGTTA